MEDKKPAFTKSYSEAKEVEMNQEGEQTKPKGLTRREFLKGTGVAALGVAAGLVLPDLSKEAS